MAHAAMKCLQACSKFPLPTRSPELFSIDHIWDLMGRKLQVSRNFGDLARQYENIWQETSQDTFRELYQSMPHSETTCIKARGGKIPYLFHTF